MSSTELDQLLAAIDTTVPPQGGAPKVTGPHLNALLRQLAGKLPTGDAIALPALSPDQLAALQASDAPSATNAVVTQSALAAVAAAAGAELTATAIAAATAAVAAAAATATAAALGAPATIVSAARGRVAYPTIFAAIAAAQPGEAVHLHEPLAEPVGPTSEAVIDLLPDVRVHLHGYDINSPDTTHDIVTFRGGKNVLYGGHATLSQRDTGGGAGAWFVGAYGGPTVDATIYDLHLRLSTYKSVGFALFAGGTYYYRGHVHSVGRYVVRMSPGTQPQLFVGEGTIWQQGGTLFWLQQVPARLEWRGDITALDTAFFNLETGTLLLRQGYLHADSRPAGAELVVQGGPTATLILENYTFGGVAGAVVGHVGTLILRGSTVVIGTIVADTVIDERPAGAAGTAAPAGQPAAPAAPDALTLPSPVPQRVAQFALAGTRSVAAYEVTQDGGATWTTATGLALPVPVAGVAAGRLGVRVAATPEGVPASAGTFLPATGAARAVPGLHARYYAGCFGDDPTFFRGRVPVFEENLVHAGRFRDPVFNTFGQHYGSLDQFSVLYEGLLRITESGNYSFGYGADDRGGIWLDEATADPRNDNRADNRGGLYLAAGLHPIVLAYGEYGGAQYADYYWGGPGVNGILNAGRLCLYSNEPLAPDAHRAPAGFLPDADFDHPMGAGGWTPAQGWDVLDGTLLGTDTERTGMGFNLNRDQLAEAYTLELDIDLAPGAVLRVDIIMGTSITTRLSTSGVHRLPVVPDQDAGQIWLAAEGSELVQVHYAQVMHLPAANSGPDYPGDFIEDTDDRLVYSGTWQAEPNTDTVYRDNEGKYVNPGDEAAVELTFTGTQFRIWGCTCTDDANVGFTTACQVLIDGQPQPDANPFVNNPSGELRRSWGWYTSPGLPGGPHTVRLAAVPGAQCYLVFDGFETFNIL